jgi:hypothetical protein
MINKIDDIVKNTVTRCKKALIDDYSNYSIIEKIVNTQDASEGIISNNFLKIGHWKYIPYHLFTDPATFPDPIFSQYGFSIAHGEVKYLINEILNNKRIDIFSTERIDINLLSSKIMNFRDQNYIYEKIIMFAPIEYFMKVHIEWPRSSSEKIRMLKGEFYIDGLPIKIYWSNKYNEFSDFIIYDKNFATWSCKPTIKNRLKVDLFRSKEDPFQMELKAETTFLLNIDQPKLVSIIRPKSPPSIQNNK